MSDPKRPKWNRREFTATSALALLSGVAVTVGACKGSSSTPSAPTPAPVPGDGRVTGAVSANHGHTAVITQAQLTAGAGVVLQIRGSSDHPHTVQLSTAEVMSIAGGGRVVKTSSNDDGHTHAVTFQGSS